MRVLVVSAQYLPTIGGVQRYTDGLTRAMVSRGHRVTILANRVAGTPWREVVDEIEILRVPSVQLLGGRYPVPLLNQEFRAINRQVWKRHYDLAVINTRFYPLSLWAARACRARRVPALVVEHGSGYLSLGSPLSDIAVRAYEHMATHVLRHYTQDFFGVSLQSAEWLQTFGVTARGVLPNAVDAAQIRAEAAAGAWDVRQRFCIPSHAPLIAYVGRLLPAKGIRELLAAMPAVQLAHPGTTLVIVGEGPLASTLTALSPMSDSWGSRRGSDRGGVLFLGPLDHPAALSLLAQADTYCLPSYSEGFATLVLEAAVLGVFGVVTSVGGTTELIPDDTYGCRIADHKPATIAAALNDALANPQRRRAAALRAQARVESLFSWDQTARWLEVCSQARTLAHGPECAA